MITSRQFFLPAVVETHGFIHHEFRRLVSILAAHVANKSAMDNDISAGERAILKGIYTARFYQRLSVALQLAVVECIASESHKILANCPTSLTNWVARSRFSLRAQTDIGAHERTANSALTHFEANT